jgi:hypothetical protein
MNADEYLRSVWLRLRDGAGPTSVAFANGAIHALLAIGSINQEKAELWTLRMEKCPGHEDDAGSRSWCAFCDEMTKLDR